MQGKTLHVTRKDDSKIMENKCHSGDKMQIFHPTRSPGGSENIILCLYNK